MNFYATRGYLDAAAAVYFKGRAATVEDVRIGDDVLRLLVVDGRIVTKMQFLDSHQPLTPAEVREPVRQGRYAPNVIRGAISQGEWDSERHHQFTVAPYIDWSQFESFEDYWEQLLRRHRGFVRERQRRWRGLVAAYGEPVFTRNDLGADVLPSARAWKSRQLQETGIADWFALQATVEFLERLRAQNLLVSSTLRADGRLMAVWIGFIHEGSWSGWVFAFDPAFARYSVGHRLLRSMFEESCRLGHHEFDFSEGGEEYKLLYASHLRLLGEIGRPPLGRHVVRSAKEALRLCSPELLLAVQERKRSLGAAATRSAGALRALLRYARAARSSS